MKTTRWSLLAYCVVFGLAFAVLAFMPLARLSFRLFFDQGAPFSLEAAIGDFTPVPRVLLWTPGIENVIIRFATLSSAGVLSVEIGLFAILLYAVLRILNPTFRVTTGVDWDSTVLSKTYMHTAPMIKAFLIAMAAALPLFMIWVVLGAVLHENTVSLCLRLGLIGSALWLLYSRDGVAGDYESGNYDFPQDRRILASLLFRGALFGFVVAAVISILDRIPPETLFTYYQSLGIVGESHWRSAFFLLCGLAALMGACAALFCVALGEPNLSQLDRCRRAVIPLALVAVAGRFVLVTIPVIWRDRYDFEPGLDERPRVGYPLSTKRLAERARLSPPSNDIDTLILFRPGGGVALNTRRISMAGLDTGPESTRNIENYLKQKEYQTALWGPAYTTLHDAASLSWNPAESLRIDTLHLSTLPNAAYLRLVLDKLQWLGDSEVARRYAALLTDATRFAYPRRDVSKGIGDLYGRAGDRENARRWYGLAEVPPGRIDELLDDRVHFAEGTITGRILLNGRPLGGARVGLVPFRMLDEGRATEIEPGVLRAFWLRWIGPAAQTDASGRFRLSHIIRGRYRLLSTSAAIKLRPFDTAFDVQNSPGDLFIGRRQPEINLGDIRITTSGSAAPKDRTQPLLKPNTVPPTR